MGFTKRVPAWKFYLSISLLCNLSLVFGEDIYNGNVKISTRAEDNLIDISFGEGNKLVGQLGISTPSAIGQATLCSSPENTTCLQWEDYAQLLIIDASESNGNCARVEWKSTFTKRLEDCFNIVAGVHWYGGGETWLHTWPIEGQSRPEVPVVTGERGEFNGVTEYYWLVSTGAAIKVDEDIPLFFSLNSVHANKVCFLAKDIFPFYQRTPLTLKYNVCLGNNLKEAHLSAQSKFYQKPTSIPDENMIIYPLWSTWAQYHADVSQEIVLEFANRILAEGYSENSHVEIDDNWENCYGQAEFNPTKFPNPAEMVRTLNEQNFRVTLWIHPFVNFGCPAHREGVEGGYFVKDRKDRFGMLSWWAGSNAGVIDFSNPDSVTWWKSRLQRLQTEYGIDSFKFDAGEADYLPYAAKMQNVDDNLLPNVATHNFVESVASFGKMVEVRAARNNQAEAIFFRMFDKDSRWGYDNGLRSIIPTLLHFGVLGYPFVLPDMIGGNAYGGRPSKELYIRWMQANAFMPAVQISLVPWDYDAETISLTKEMLDLRIQYRDEILLAVNQSTTGSPINRPMWWVDPEDQNTYDIDSQYMLGDNILVAPILTEGATARDIYLPVGTWNDGISVEVHNGPGWIRNFPAPLNTLPFFIKQ